MNFIEQLKTDKLVRLLGTAINFVYHQETNTVLPVISPGVILSRQEVQELIQELQKFYNTFSDADIEKSNRIYAESHQPSLTEQPKLPRKSIPGWVYLVKAEDINQYKIGQSKAPNIRLKALQKQSPIKLTLIHLIQCADVGKAEANLHKRFADYKVSGEWFELDQVSVDYIKSLEVL